MSGFATDLPIEQSIGEMVPTGYVVGVDLGQARDFTAVVVNERHEAERISRQHRGEPGQYGYAVRERRDKVVHHRLTFLYRFQLGTSYPDVVDAVQRLLEQLPAMRDKPALAVDTTGVGRPVFDMMKAKGLQPIGITITAGSDVVEKAKDDVRVPKRLLASILQVVLQTERLKIAAEMELTPLLTRELETFKVKINVAGSETFEAWREADHDDLVLAAALAVWWAERPRRGPMYISPEALARV